MVYILVVGTTAALPWACSFSARLSHTSTMDAPCALFVLAHAFITAANGTCVGSKAPMGISVSFRFMRNSHSRFLDFGEAVAVVIIMLLVDAVTDVWDMSVS
jgi:hypothetical protein